MQGSCTGDTQSRTGHWERLKGSVEQVEDGKVSSVRYADPILGLGLNYFEKGTVLKGLPVSFGFLSQLLLDTSWATIPKSLKVPSKGRTGPHVHHSLELLKRKGSVVSISACQTVESWNHRPESQRSLGWKEP